MSTQRERVLEALKSAPRQKLTTGQLHKIPYICNPRARVSELRSAGHIILVTPIKGTNSSTYQYLGQHSSMENETSTSWRWASDGLEVLEIGGRL